jgi:FMN phosphatase YigB (HAD superfamily)
LQGVLFDWRGTLFTDEGDVDWVRNAALSIGRVLDDADVAGVVASIDGAEHDPAINSALQRCDTSLDVNRDAMLAWFRRAGLDDELARAVWLRDGDPEATFPFDDTHDVLERLHRHGVGIAVVSDIHYDIRPHFQRHELDDFVDAYVLSFEHGCQKPDAEMFQRGLDALEVPAHRALMVGDRPSHDGGAVELGIATYILPGPYPAGDRSARGLDATLALVGIA